MVATAPVPHDEKARLQALHGFEILGTPPEERFDLFTKMAGWLFKAPVAAINFVDAEATFFKSLVGMTPYAPPRNTAVCAHAICDTKPVMIVNDLAEDRRFSDHPLFLNAGIRFYAGAVLRSTSGHALGTLCVADRRPRRMGAAGQQQLLELADGVGTVLDLHMKSLLLHKSAVTDPLTGLYNRRMFADALQNAVARSTPQEPCLLLSLDLDHFKRVNDQFGHAAGDALLCEVGQRLSQTVRAGDVVARLGGDEFAIVISGTVTTDWPEQLAARILAAFATPLFFEGHPLEISSSIGIARCPHDAADPEALLRCADSALYEAKQSGRNQYKAYQQAGMCRRRS